MIVLAGVPVDDRLTEHPTVHVRAAKLTKMGKLDCNIDSLMQKFQRSVCRFRRLRVDLSVPSTLADWRGFLPSYSSEFLESDFLREAEQDGRAQHLLSDTQRSAGWLGYDPATEDSIVAAEKKLGIRLPSTYRNFLLASNGWRTISYSVDLLKVHEIGWFAELEPDLLDAWSELEHFTDELKLLRRCLLISNDDGGSGHYLLLHADVVADNGEWPAYEWWPGDGDDPVPHADFATLVTSLWKEEYAYRASRSR